MKSLLRVLRAAHCRSTHHLFAVDALPLVQTAPGRRLVRLLLRHHRRYLAGAVDPDERFRDFQNHVIHVADGGWGGAPRVADQWYDALQRSLRRWRISDAAHAAGVLSHYFTDPIQPLHTHQCRRGEVAHAPLEWSIFRSYETIHRGWSDDEFRVVFQLGDGPDWLSEAIQQAARFAHRKYGPLIEAYRLDRAAANPSAALDAPSRQMLSELFGLAITGWARIIERAAADAESVTGTVLPNVSLVWPMAAATVRSPDRRVARWIETSRRREAVAELVAEYQRTGSLQQHLPAEVDVIRRVIRVHDDERRWRQRSGRQVAGAQASRPTLRVVHGEDSPDPSEVSATQPSRRRSA